MVAMGGLEPPTQVLREAIAFIYARRLTQLYPSAAAPRQTLEQLESMRKRGVQQ